jgi:predicted metal-dependent peptidase
MNPRDIEKAARAISKARAQLILGHPFFATLALRLDPRPDPRAQTIATDGRCLYYSPAWINAQPPADLPGVIAHEAMHVALGHAFRRQNREHERFNLAADHAINPLLKEAGFSLPKGGCSVVKAAYPGLSAEQIYPLLPESQEGGGAGAGGGQGEGFPDFGGTGCVLDATGDDGKALTEAERTQLEAEWKIATLQAAQAAKAQGKLPAGLEALADSIRAPQVDWRAVLREFVRSVAAGDYSWRRPNPRMLGTGDYLPSLYSEETGPIAMGVDTSGSVSQAELDAVCAELNGCLDTARPESVHVVYCDAQVHGHQEFKPDDWPVTMQAKGRGGTHLAPVWPYLREHDIDPVCAIITTDMELCVRDLGEAPDFPVLILSTGRDAPMDGPLPFGTLVKVDAGT